MDECLKSLAQSALRMEIAAHPQPGGEGCRGGSGATFGGPSSAVCHAIRPGTHVDGVGHQAVRIHRAQYGRATAAHLSGVLTLEEALHLVWLRGQLFETLPAGAMLSVGMDPNELRTLMSPGLDIAAINAPTLCVASGPVALVDELQRTLTERGVDTRRVRVAAAAHSRMVDPILDEFRAFFSRVTLRPQVPPTVERNWRVADVGGGRRPEYWVATFAILCDSRRACASCADAPGTAACCSKLGQDARSRRWHGYPDRPPLQPVLTSARHPDEAGSDVAIMLGTLGRLWSHGVAIDWTAFTANEQPHKVPLPTYPFARTRHWIEAPEGHDVALDSAPASGEGGKRADIGSWFYRPQWQRRRLLQSATKTRGGVIIFADENGGEARGAPSRLARANRSFRKGVCARGSRLYRAARRQRGIRGVAPPRPAGGWGA